MSVYKEEGPFEEPIPRDLGEFDAGADLLVKLHFYHEHATALDAGTEESRQQLQVAGLDSMGQQRYAWPSVDPALVPTVFDQIEWKPYDDTETSHNVDLIYTRFPVLHGREYGLSDDTRLTPKDVFVEIVYKIGVSHYYLLNDHGLFPMDRGATVAYSADELEDPMRDPEDKPNVFSVSGAPQHTPPMPIQALLRMIDRDSGFTQTPR